MADMKGQEAWVYIGDQFRNGAPTSSLVGSVFIFDAHRLYTISSNLQDVEMCG